jgi:NAD(P)-dependent dehydrogenase (short-subunit alcohol dehydrogenase family)
VTGASRGIGHAAAQCLADLGANVVLTTRTHEAADVAAEKMCGAVGFAAHRCVDFALGRFGRLDILVKMPQPMPGMARSSTSATIHSAKRLTSMCGRRSCGHPWRRGHG